MLTTDSRPPFHRSGLQWLLGYVSMGILLAACAKTDEPAAAAPQPVANDAFNLSFHDIPEGFDVETNEGEILRLSSASEERQGTMWVEVSERSDYGIDLVGIVNSQKAQFEEREGGDYSGARKLVTPAGEAYYARGRYQEADQQVEETRVFLLHPTENRLVAFHYLYPAADDSAERLPELFAWVAEIDTGTTSPDEAASAP